MCRRSGRCFFSRRFDGAAPRLPTRALDDARRRLRRRRLARAGDARDAPLLVLFHGLEGSSSSHYARGLRRRGDAARLALRGAALSRLLGRDQPGAARLPLGRPRGGRLDARRAFARSHARADRRRRRLARRQCAAALRRGSGRERGASACARSPRSRRRSTSPPAAARSAAASAARSTRACSCAR